MSRIIERLGLSMLRCSTKRSVLLIEPPSYAVQYLHPLPPAKPPSEITILGRAGIWLIHRANPLAYVNSRGAAIKVTLP